VIGTLRRRHRIVWRLLALLAPAVLCMALVVRAGRPSEVAMPLSPDLRAALGAAPDLAGEPMLPGLKLRARVLAGGAAGTRLLELQPSEPLLEPDVLVYALSEAAARTGAAEDSLPADARLLGALSGTLARRWALPADATALLLFSLAHQQVLARAALPVAAEGPR